MLYKHQPTTQEAVIPAPKKALDALAAYRAAIENDLKKGIATEHTYRPALKTLIEALGAGVEAVNEPRQVECGAPDFTILKKDLRLGNIECKGVGKPLGDELKSEQLKRYRKALPNLILTDYLEFRWFVRGEERGEPVRLVSVAGKKLRPEPDGPEALARLLNAFLTEEIPTITGPKELAERMASLAQMIRAAISRALAREEEGGTLHEQLKGFRKVLLHDLDKEQFADMYAQTICYGLFAARCNTKPGQPFTRNRRSPPPQDQSFPAQDVRPHRRS